MLIIILLSLYMAIQLPLGLLISHMLASASEEAPHG